MAGPRKIILNEQQYAELQKTCTHHPLPYVRERASGILKVASGKSMSWVGKHGLLHFVHHETISHWIDRYLEEGISGLRVKTGRGRKPAFFPSARKYRNSSSSRSGNCASFA